MRRFLVFLLIFPAIATVSAYAIIYILTSAVVDSFSGPGLIYLVCMILGLILALVDWGFSKTRLPAFVGTTFLVYAALVGYLAWEGSARWIFALGLIAAIPAAVGSWLSGSRARA